MNVPITLEDLHSADFKTIPGYIRYEINARGQVRHVKHKKILKQSRPLNGYLQVNIYNDALNRRCTKCIHHLMALTFLGPKPEGFEVSYKDQDKINNALSNLHYVFWRDNRPYSSKVSCAFCGSEVKYEKICCSLVCRFRNVLRSMLRHGLHRDDKTVEDMPRLAEETKKK